MLFEVEIFMHEVYQETLLEMSVREWRKWVWKEECELCWAAAETRGDALGNSGVEIGEGTGGDPLQYSCLENPMGGGAW